MKKFLLILFKPLSLFFLFFFFFSSPILAGCNPPDDYSTCPEQRPDLNVNLLNPVPISGNLNLNDFWGGETDPKAPQLSTLIDNNPTPAVTSLHQLHYWDWTTNSPGKIVPRPSNLGSNYDFATQVGFSTSPNQAILVPDSGYDIGGGYEVMVLFATSDSVTLKYTREDNVFKGYTLYLNNIQVDPELLTYYDQLNQAGRSELPALMAGTIIGTAAGNEILVAIRDTGTFMDPRWQLAWWQNIAAGNPIKMVLKPMEILKEFSFPFVECSPTVGGDYDSRPVPCEACNQTNSYTDSCATSFAVNDEVRYHRGDIDFQCEGKPWLERQWQGMVVVDPSKTTVPFVGKKGLEDEQKYLADYFEGTNEYYENYSHYWKNWVNHAGVFRKLSPMEYQDQLKKKMVGRAKDSLAGQIQEGAVHDYNLNYIGRLCWDAPFWAQALVAIAGHLGLDPLDIWRITNYCLFSDRASNPLDDALIAAVKLILDNSPIKISHWQTNGFKNNLSQLANHLPPNPEEKDYVQKWKDWKKSEWGKLWEVVPMFTREDTPGQIFPYLGARPKDIFAILNPEAQIEKVPHLARLSESSQEVKKILFPFLQEINLTQGKITNSLASASKQEEKRILGEKTYLAQGQGECFNLSIQAQSVPQDNGALVIVSAQLYSPPGGGDGHIRFSVGGHETIVNTPWNKGVTNPFVIIPKWTDSPFFVANGQSKTVTYSASIDNCQGRMAYDSATCSFSVDNKGKFTTNCKGAPSPEPVCGLADSLPVPSCEREAITDPNPNDDICCDSIRIVLSATDQFINPNYIACGKKTVCDTDVLGQNICHDACEEEKTYGVSRDVGIALLHPYLEQIWDQTANDKTNGVFNFLKPAGTPKFRELDAASTIGYGYTPGSATPTVGKFYFPYLGGTQLAKEWLIRALTPWGK